MFKGAAHNKCNINYKLPKLYPVVFTAENKDDNVAQRFVDTLKADIKRIYNMFKFPKK